MDLSQTRTMVSRLQKAAQNIADNMPLMGSGATSARGDAMALSTDIEKAIQNLASAAARVERLTTSVR